jgi:tRNA A37 methylthiotransferase MiaB
MHDVEVSDAPTQTDQEAGQGETVVPSLAGRGVFTASEVSCGTSKSLVAGYRDFLVRHGARKVDDVAEADIILIDTCAYSAASEARSIANIGYQQKHARADAKVIVTGCLAAINPGSIKSVFAGEMFSPKNQEQLGKIFGIGEQTAKEFFKPTELRSGFTEPRKHEPVRNWVYAHHSFWINLASALHAINNRVPVERVAAVQRVLARSQYFNPRAYNIAISQGCIGNCSFCAIPFAKGRTRSVQLGAIIDKIKEMAAAGVKDFILTSEDSGAYGIDIGITIVTLLEQINRLEEDVRIHIAFFDPRWLKKYETGLLRALESGRIKYLQMPMQSGSDPILRAMRRGYQVEHAAPVIRKIRTTFPELCVTSQFIAGFPGETEDDFRGSMALVESEYFDFAQGFPFEDRPGTATNDMTNHLPVEVRAARAKEINDFYHRKSIRLFFRSVPIAADVAG